MYIYIDQLISSISDDDSTIVMSTLWSSYRDEILFRCLVDFDGFNERCDSSIFSRRPGLRRQRRRTSSVLMVVRFPCLNKWFHKTKNESVMNTWKMHQDLDKMFLFVEMWYLQLLQRPFYRLSHSIEFVIDHKFFHMLHEVLSSISELKIKINR